MLCPVVDCCCFCFKIETGTILLATITAAEAFFDIIRWIDGTKHDLAYDAFTSGEIEEQTTQNLVTVIYILSLINDIMYIITAILLLIGMSMKKTKLLKPFMIWAIIGFFIMTGVMILNFFMMGLSDTPKAVMTHIFTVTILVVAQLYIIWVTYCCIKTMDMKMEERTADAELC